MTNKQQIAANKQIASPVTRRTFLLGASSLLSLAVLGGCVAVPPVTEVPANAPTPAVEATAEAAAESSTEATTRLIAHEMGETEIPVDPQRIVALHPFQVMGPLMDIGVTPIASNSYDGNRDFSLPEKYDTSQVQDVGTILEPNLEAILQLQPDLIIGLSGQVSEERYAQLSDIAPTIILSLQGTIEEFQGTLAQAVNRSAEFETLLAEYETRITELRTAAEAIKDDLTVSVLAFNGGAGQVQIAKLAYTRVIEEAGIRQPEAQINFDTTDKTVNRIYISLEELPAHDADFIFLLNSGDPAVNDPIKNSPVWQNLNAVKAEQWVEFSNVGWVLQSVTSLINIVNDLETYLIKQPLDLQVMPS